MDRGRFRISLTSPLALIAGLKRFADYPSSAGPSRISWACLILAIWSQLSPIFSATYPAYLPADLATLPQGTLLRGHAEVGDLKPYGPALRASAVPAQGQSFNQALRLEIPAAGAAPWDAGIRLPIPMAVAQGDACLMCLWSRLESTTDESGEGRLDVLVERSGGDYAKSLFTSLGLTPVWKRTCYPFVFANAFDSAGAHLGLNFGHKSQTLQVGGIDLVFFGKQVTLEQLKVFTTPDSYQGREPGAAWRKSAALRIDSLRKARLDLTVHKEGQPVAGAKVRVRMQRHAFPFGTAVAADRISYRMIEENRRYRDTLKVLFNHAVIENHLKWRHWTPGGAVVADSAVSWLRSQDLTVRGHVLVWPSWRNMPTGVSQTDSALLHRQILTHIDTMTARYRGQLIDWDVLNEPYDNHDAMDLIGNRAMGDWFRRAHAGDSSARLYINDYAILSGDEAGHRAHYFDVIRKLLDEKAPLHGIGVQGHFGSSPTGIETVLRRLDTLAGFGLPVKVTEFDVDTDDEELQADYTRDFLTAFFSHPAAAGFLIWGFWEKAHWRPRAAMYRLDWSVKPNALAFRKLLFDDWWTDTAGVAAADGGFALRGFHGDYVLEIEGEGKRLEVPVSLMKDTKLNVDLMSGAVVAIAQPLAVEGSIRFRRGPARGLGVLEATGGYPLSARLITLAGRELGYWTAAAGERLRIPIPVPYVPGVAVLVATSGPTKARFLLAP